MNARQVLVEKLLPRCLFYGDLPLVPVEHRYGQADAEARAMDISVIPGFFEAKDKGRKLGEHGCPETGLLALVAFLSAARSSLLFSIPIIISSRGGTFSIVGIAMPG